MELRTYLQILLRRWRIALAAFLSTFVTTIMLTFTQTPVYEASTTYIVTPAGVYEDVRSLVDGLDTLSRRTEIASTYAKVAASRLIKQQAADALFLSKSQVGDLAVSGRLVAGTNVIEITVEGSDPGLVELFANMVGVKTASYVLELYDTIGLRPLDSATMPRSPVSPRKGLNLALGVVCGLALGAGLAFFAEYLQAPRARMDSFSILDEETGAYNERYFRHRLRAEISRARRNGYPLSLALLDFDQLRVTDRFLPSQVEEVEGGALPQLAEILRQNVREEDIISHFDGSWFALLMPDVPAERAETVVDELLGTISSTPLEIQGADSPSVHSSITAVVALDGNCRDANAFLVEAHRALQQAKTAGRDVLERGDPAERPPAKMPSIRGPKPKYPVELTTKEEFELRIIVRAPDSTQEKVDRARILLTAHDHPERHNKQIAQEVGCAGRTVRRWRRRWFETRSIEDLPPPGAPLRTSPGDTGLQRSGAESGPAGTVE
jgi:diguanylate cyclase (GGDEF)-like protein